ncbi:MAG: DNA-directed RNA polymerase subunit omega [Ignavibacteria bacterium]|nr:DNA-directed RNA polymerase subunit omega [Ignavibacteria bacterium]
MQVRPVDLRKVEQHASNIYEAVIVSAKRARQINAETKQEFSGILSTMVGAPEDEFDERGNPEQLNVSLEFEKRPKPHIQALNELIEGKIKYSMKD